MKSVLTQAPEEKYADDYEKRGDYWFLKVESTTITVDGKDQTWSLDNVGGLKNELADRKERHQKSQARVEELEKTITGKDEELDKLRNAKPDEKVAAAHKAEIDQLKTKHSDELKKRDEREGVLTGAVDKHARRAAVRRALAKHTKDADAAELMLPHVMSQTDMIEEDGEFVVIVKGKDGNPRISMKENSGTDRMTVDELVGTEMAKDKRFALAFPGSGAAGSGSSGTGSARGGSVDTSKMSPEEKVAYGRKMQAGG